MNYIDEQTFLDLWQQAHDAPQDRKAQDEYVTFLLLLASSIASRFPKHLRNDLAQDAACHCWIQSASFDPTRGTIFAYLTSLCFNRMRRMMNIEGRQERIKLLIRSSS